MLSALTLAGVAGVGGYILGRATAEDGATAPATATEEAGGGETVPAETGEGAETAEVETEAGEATDGDAQAGAQVFAQAGCGNCHTLEQANATGQVGPNLNETDLDEDEIRDTVENGRDGMPAFRDQLEDEEIDNVAAFVAASKTG